MPCKMVCGLRPWYRESFSWRHVVAWSLMVRSRVMSGEGDWDTLWEKGVMERDALTMTIVGTRLYMVRAYLHFTLIYF